jgi:hypothetical protein
MLPRHGIEQGIAGAGVGGEGQAGGGLGRQVGEVGNAAQVEQQAVFGGRSK